MAVSGITTYQLTGNDIVNAAMRKIGIMAKGQVADTEELLYGLQALNTLIPTLRNRGMQLWKQVTTTLPLVAGSQTYTLSQPNKPSKILQAWISPGSGSKIPVLEESIFNINILPSTSSGVPVKFAYIPRNTDGVVTLWPMPSATVASIYTFSYVYQDELDVVTDGSQTLDFPAEWQLPLIYGVASLIAPESNVPIQDRQQLDAAFERYVSMAEENTGENASIYFEPDRTR